MYFLWWKTFTLKYSKWLISVLIVRNEKAARIILKQILKVTVSQTGSLQPNKFGNTELCSGWSRTHSLEECLTSRTVPRCGHLPLSPTHLTSTPAAGQWTCNLVAAGQQPGRHTHTPHPAAAALQSHSVCLSAAWPPVFSISILTRPASSSLSWYLSQPEPQFPGDSCFTQDQR